MLATSIGVNSGTCLPELSYRKNISVRRKLKSTSSYILQEMVITESKNKIIAKRCKVRIRRVRANWSLLLAVVRKQDE